MPRAQSEREQWVSGMVIVGMILWPDATRGIAAIVSET